MFDPDTINRVIELVGAFLIAHITSAGFWAYIARKREKRSLQTELLVGLAHDRITWLSLMYIDRGFITADEHENLQEYLFKPYEKLGGNGSAKRLIEEVNRLPTKTIVIKHNKKEI